MQFKSHFFWARLALLLIAASAHCGGHTGDQSSAGAGCPATPPADGSSCDPQAFLSCEYGGDPHGLCTTSANCDLTKGIWHVTTPQPGCGTNASSCPAAYGQGQGGSCPTQSMCEYDQGVCGCSTCVSEAGPQQAGLWTCSPYDAGPGCPAVKPLLGTSCTGGAMCAYGGCCNRIGWGELACTDGTWQPYATCGCGLPPACP